MTSNVGYCIPFSCPLGPKYMGTRLVATSSLGTLQMQKQRCSCILLLSALISCQHKSASGTSRLHQAEAANLLTCARRLQLVAVPQLHTNNQSQPERTCIKFMTVLTLSSVPKLRRSVATTCCGTSVHINMKGIKIKLQHHHHMALVLLPVKLQSPRF